MPTGMIPTTDHARARHVRDGLIGDHRQLYLTNARFHAWVDTMAHVMIDAADGAAIAWEADTRDVSTERALLAHLTGATGAPEHPMAPPASTSRAWAAWT